MKGFFTKEETKSTTRKDGKTYSCISCGMYKTCDSPKMKPFGKFKKGILNVIESPSNHEDRKGKHIRDSFLNKIFAENGINMYEDCLNTFSVKCRPPNEVDLNKMNFELDCCRLHLMRVIKKYKPKVIIVYGKNSLYSVIGSRWEGALGSLEKWRGSVIPDQDLNAWIAPVYHSHLAVKEKHLTTIFQNDIKLAVSHLDIPFKKFVKPTIHYLRNGLRRLNTIKAGELITTDIETTGLKPHEKGHRIICASVAVSADKVYAFMLPKEKAKREPYIQLLKNRNIRKAAHNIAYEHLWFKNRLGVKVKGWHWCSLQMAHIMDNRTGVTGLKFQVYVNFGLMDYSSEVTPYLKGNKKNANSFNKLLKYVENEHNMDLLLEYVAYDSAVQYKLMEHQKDILENKILPF